MLTEVVHHLDVAAGQPAGGGQVFGSGEVNQSASAERAAEVRVSSTARQPAGSRPHVCGAVS